MKVHHFIESIERPNIAVVTSGMFDGVHRGHQKILTRLKEISELIGGESVVLTFWPHPRMVVSEDSQNLQLLSTLDEKITLLEDFGIDHLFILPFTRTFSELSCEAYVRKILLEGIGTKKLVIGYDHHFGRNREGNFEYLKRNESLFGFEVEEIPRQEIDELAVSSSRIRKDLTTGLIEEANSLLGRPYSFSGTVVKGRQLGRTIGFPTANLQLHEDYKLIPAHGVYAVRATHGDNRYKGMLNIGTRPTVDGTNRTIEVNLFDFDKDIYGENLKIELLKYLRPEQKFESLDALKEQIQRDKINALLQ